MGVSFNRIYFSAYKAGAGALWLLSAPATPGRDEDSLQQMLRARAAKFVATDQMRTRVAGEVDGMMDNGVRINPLLREMYGSNDETSAIDAMLGLT